ncbi:MAG: hypothetical protein ACO1RX_05470 [Candidatus Sericytochromatia bacterium]
MQATLKSGKKLEPPYFEFMVQAIDVLKGFDRHVLLLEPEAYNAFSCTMCAQCCQRPWWIALTREYHDKWLPIFENHPSGRFPQPFVLHKQPLEHNYADIRRKAGTSECLFLEDDRSCWIQNEYGHEALSYTCQSFPRYEGWMGAFMGRFLLNSCPETPLLVQQHPDILYQIVTVIPEMWQHFERYTHPVGVYNAYLLLGLELDLLRNSALTAVQTMRCLTGALRAIYQHGVEKTDVFLLQGLHIALQNRTAPGQVPPPAYANRSLAMEWMLTFTAPYASLQRYLREIQKGVRTWPVLSDAEQQDLNVFLRTYLNYRVLTLNSYPYQQEALLFHAFFQLFMHLALLQWVALFYRAHDGGPLTQEHLVRAATLVGYRFEHAQKSFERYQLERLSPTDCLNGMDTLLHFDFGAPDAA